MNWLKKILAKFIILPPRYETGALFDPRSSGEKALDWKDTDIAGLSGPLYAQSKPALPSLVDDQKGTNECGPHAATLALGLLEEKLNGRFMRLSKDFFYRLRSNYPAGGMYLKDLGSVAKNYGSCAYSSMPTSENDDQANKRVITDDLMFEAAVFKAGGYFQLTDPTDIDAVASLLASGVSVILFTYATVQEWAQEYPQVYGSVVPQFAPIRHFVAAYPKGAYIENGKRYISIDDSARFGNIEVRRLSEDWIKQRTLGALFYLELERKSIGPKPQHQFSLSLEQGDRGEEVLWLQKVLAYEALLPKEGLTGYFGPMTFAAVKAYQNKYADEILKPSYLSSATGYVGPATIKHLNYLYATMPQPTIEQMCLSIKNYEGFFPPGTNPKHPNGTASWRNNNPGNCRFNPGGYRAIYGEVKKSPDNFAVFKDYATGWLYLNNLVRQKVEAHPKWTLLEFFEDYAPVDDGNDPVRYSKTVAGDLGVTADFIIGNIKA